MKSFFVFGLILLFWPLLARTQEVYYQSGDFKFENGRGLIAAPNGVGIDILDLSEHGRLSLASRVLSKAQPFSAVFAKDGDETTLVVASGRYLEKFLISDPQRPVLKLVLEIPGHYFYHVSKIDESSQMVLLSSTKGVQVRLVRDFSLVKVFAKEETALGASWSKNNFAPIVSQSKIILGDKSGELITWEDLTQKKYIRQPQATNLFGYFPTDQGLVRLSPSGQVKIYKPKTLSGNSVLISRDEKNVYFANGWGIIKLDSELKYKKSIPLSGSGFWAAGMAWVRSVSGKNYLAVFNGKGLRILDEDLKILFTWEPAKLNIEKNFKVNMNFVDNEWVLSGTGFYPGEDIEIYKDNRILSFAQASNLGSFSMSLGGFRSGVVRTKGSSSGLQFETYIK